MPEHFNILHLSDIHLSRDVISDYNQSVVLKALEEDLKRLCSGRLRPDLVIFSGDLVYAADQHDSHLIFYDKVIDPISKITGCSESRIILCPGNHDAHRSYISKNIHLRRSFSETMGDRNSTNELYLQGKISEYVENSFSSYFELQKYLTNKPAAYENCLAKVEHLENVPIDVVTLNTAWMTGTGLTESGRDERALLFPEAALEEASRECRPETIRIYVSHHPTNWLSEHCENDFLNCLTNADGNLLLHLYGHMHDPRPTQISARTGTLLTNQCGALYTSRDRYNGYALIRLALADKQVAVNLRSYFDDRKKFDSAIDKVENGVFYPSNDAKQFWYKADRRIDKSKLRECASRTLLPAVRRLYDEGMADKPVGDIFVAPPMCIRDDQSGHDEDDAPISNDGSPVTFDQIIESNKNLILHGRQESGKTTLLQQITISMLEKINTSEEDPIIPFIIDFKDLRAGESPVIRAISRSLICELDGITVKSISEEGLALIIVDDFEFESKDKLKILADFILEYPHNRFILSTTTNLTQEIASALGEHWEADTETMLSFEHVFIQPLSRNNIRDIVKKWDVSEKLGRHEETIKRISDELRSMQISPTAVNSTILLSIYQSQKNFQPVNRANLIEMFVEHVLEKRSPAEALRATYDFKTKIFLLSHLAEFMARNDLYKIQYGEINKKIQGFLDDVGFEANADDFVELFLTARVLYKDSEEYVSFRYGAFTEYFIASQMKDNPVFREWVLDESRYLSFINEIQYYAGLERRDANLLEMISERFSQLSNEMAKKIEWQPDVNLIENFTPPANDSIDLDDIASSFERQIAAPPMTEEERDEVLSTELPKDAKNGGDIIRPNFTNEGQKWLFALMLYSSVLKNLELIGDTAKRRHLVQILHGWSQLTAHSIYLIPSLAKSREMYVNGVRYLVNMPREFSEAKIARIISIELPNSMSKLIMWHLGTEKLSKQLKEPSFEDVSEPKIVSFFRHALICDLKLPGWVESLKVAGDLFSQHPYLLESFLRKVTEVYLLGDYQKETAKKIQTIASDLSAGLFGKTKADKQNISDKSKKRLERRNYVRRLQVLSLKDKE